MTLTSGCSLQDRYQIISALGQGGMGAVYRARDTRLDVIVAVKEMLAQPGLDVGTLGELREQFEQEAKVLARLRHPNLVRVSDFFIERENAYLVMDFVEGESLDQRIRREGMLTEVQVLDWAAELLDALAYCHSQGVIHRDVKPQNVILAADDRAILVDFGLVKLWDPSDPITRTVLRGMGTMAYAPPEQYGARVGHTDPRSDLYSLGSTLYHALTGQAPPTATDRMADPDHFAPPRRLNPNVSGNTESVILEAMSLSRAERYASAHAMRSALLRPTELAAAIPASEVSPARTAKLTEVLPEEPALTETAEVPTAVSEDLEFAPAAGEEPVPPWRPDETVAIPRVREAPDEETTPKAVPVPVRRRPRRLWALGGIVLLLVAAGLLWRFSFPEGWRRDEPTSIPRPTMRPTSTKKPAVEIIPTEPPHGDVVLLATDARLHPMSFLDDRGELAGFEIDLAHLIGERVDLRVEFINVPREDLFEMLLIGEVDAVISSVTITDERAERFDFSDPYFNAGLVIVTRPDSHMENQEDLRTQLIGVQADTYAVAVVERIGEIGVRPYDELHPAFIDLVEGRLDAVVCDLLTAVAHRRDVEPSLRILDDRLTDDLYGIVLRKGEHGFLDRVNEGLHLLRQEGILRELEDHWLR